MKRFIQQLLSVQVYRGKFPVLHSSSRARHCTLDRHLLILGLCNRKENPQSPKPCWQNSLSQSLGPMICGPHTHRKLLEHTRIHRKKTTLHTTVHHSDINSIRSLVSGCNYTFRGWPTLALQSYVIIHMRWKGQQHKGRSSTAYLTGVKLWISN